MCKKILVPLLFLSLFFVRCSNKDNNNNNAHEKLPNENLVGTVLNIPDTLHYLYNDTLKKELHSNKYSLKIVTKIWGDCFSCIDSLSKWKHFASKERENKDFGLYIFIYTSRYPYFKRNFYPVIDLNYPLIIDKNDKLSEMNNFDLNKMYATFLLDSTNKVVLTGNPIYNKKLMKLYKEEINKRLVMQ